MNQELIKIIAEYVENNIAEFHSTRIEKLKSINLKDFLSRKNPYMFKAKNIVTAGDMVESLASAYMSSAEESIFGNWMEGIANFVAEKVYAGYKSAAEGIDIEFVDALDGRKKYCQCKAGPQTINNDDVATILGHFTHLQNKARLDRLNIGINDMIVGVLYGEPGELSHNYKNVDKTCPVYCGAEFWEHLTGDRQFYYRLVKAFGEVMEEDSEAGHIVMEMVNDLTFNIKEYVDTYAYKSEHS